MNIEVYTDGSATTKEKPGGWAWVLIVNSMEHSSGSGSMPNATNNDAELEGAIQGLGNALKLIINKAECGYSELFDEEFTITLCSDSEIILKWANGTNRFKQVDKQEKYEQLKRLMKRLKAHTRWVEGHAGHEWNEKCDKMARAERRKAMGKPEKKESSKSTLMLRALKEIAKISKSDSILKDPEDHLREIYKVCEPFLGSR